MAHMSRDNYPKPAVYCHKWRQAISLPAGTKATLGWAGRELDAAGMRREFCNALDNRINHRAGLDHPRGRKDDQDYQRHLFQDCLAIRANITQRIALHQLQTPELRKRFSHLITSYTHY